jgi:hypothetical protein
MPVTVTNNEQWQKTIAARAHHISKDVLHIAQDALLKANMESAYCVELTRHVSLAEARAHGIDVQRRVQTSANTRVR